MLPALTRFLFLFLLVLAGSMPARAGDIPGEQHLAAALSQLLTNGEVVWLDASGQRFFGIYTPAEVGATRGAAVIVPDFGANADWPDVVEPLRSRLPRGGWATLSVQPPVPVSDAPVSAYGAELPVVAKRIRAAVAFLRQKTKNVPIVLIGHGLGGAICARAIASDQTQGIAALVGIGMGSLRPLQPMLDVPAQLRKIRLPVLDLYGSQDLDRVLRMAPKRRAAAREAGNKDYEQMMVDGAGHGFHDMNDLLVARVRGWMNKQTGPASSGREPGSNAKETP